MENYWRSKRILFEQLTESVHKNKSAIANADDALAANFLSAVDDGVKNILIVLVLSLVRRSVLFQLNMILIIQT